MFDVYEVPEGRRYWVVRADGGRYYDHFRHHGLIALGHLDILSLQDTEETPFTPNSYRLRRALERKHHQENIKKGTTTSHYNQIMTFIRDMNVGDWVIVIGRNSVCFGRITGHPRLHRAPLEMRYGKNNERVVEMYNNLRRSVSWGVEVPREKLPYPLLSSMRAYQAVFNIDQHWEAIYHTLYPMFSRGDRLFFSLEIGAQDRISNYYLTSLLSYLNDIEVIANCFDEHDLSRIDFDALFREYAITFGITTTTKAQFHSPGEIWTSVAKHIDRKMVYLLLGYTAIFGNNVLGYDGILDLDTRHKIRDIIIERYNAHYMEDAAEKLKLTAPQIDTSSMESAEQDEEPLRNYVDV